MIFSLYKKELISYFKTPLAYLFLALILFFTGTIFTLSFLFTANQNFPAYLQVITSLFAIIAPLLTMRSFSEEFKNKTDQLLLTLPLPLHSIVIAKFLAILTIFSVILGVLLSYLIILSAFGNPDWLHIFAAFIGYFLLGCMLLSLGMAVSSYTQHQFLAAIFSFILIVGIILLGSLLPIFPKSSFSGAMFLVFIVLFISWQVYQKTHSLSQSSLSAGILLVVSVAFVLYDVTLLDNLLPTIGYYLSPLHRYQSFNQGLINLSDAYFFVCSSLFFLYICYLNLEKHYYKES